MPVNKKADMVSRAIGPTNESGFAIPAAGSAARDRVEAFGRAERHSRRVRRLKILLPTAAVAIAAAFIGNSYVLVPAKVDVDLEGAAISEGKLVMANPKLEGFTAGNRPYSMTAVRATQDFDTQGIVDLEGISARMPVEAGNWAELSAETGVYDREANTIELNTNVTVKTTDGMVARLETAFLDIDAGTLKSGKPVDIRMKGAAVTADSMTVLENGKVVVFDRRVRMNIEPGHVQSAQSPSGGTNASN